LPLLVINYLTAGPVYERGVDFLSGDGVGTENLNATPHRPFAFLAFLGKSNRVLAFFSPLVLEGRINETTLATRQGACRFEVIKHFAVC